ncbi:hypothetical protein ILUMI_11802, partial [Ignelater luminosus]
MKLFQLPNNTSALYHANLLDFSRSRSDDEGFEDRVSPRTSFLSKEIQNGHKCKECEEHQQQQTLWNTIANHAWSKKIAKLPWNKYVAFIGITTMVQQEEEEVCEECCMGMPPHVLCECAQDEINICQQSMMCECLNNDMNICGAPTGICGSPTGICGSPTGICGAPNGICGAHTGICGAHAGMYGEPTGMYGTSTGTCGAHSNICGMPSNICGSPTNICGMPNNICGSPTNVCGMPNNICGDIYGQNEYNICGTQTDVCGAQKAKKNEIELKRCPCAVKLPSKKVESGTSDYRESRQSCDESDSDIETDFCGRKRYKKEKPSKLDSSPCAYKESKMSVSPTPSIKFSEAIITPIPDQEGVGSPQGSKSSYCSYGSATKAPASQTDVKQRSPSVASNKSKSSYCSLGILKKSSSTTKPTAKRSTLIIPAANRKGTKPFMPQQTSQSLLPPAASKPILPPATSKSLLKPPSASKTQKLSLTSKSSKSPKKLKPPSTLNNSKPFPPSNSKPLFPPPPPQKKVETTGPVTGSYYSLLDYCKSPSNKKPTSDQSAASVSSPYTATGYGPRVPERHEERPETQKELENKMEKKMPRSTYEQGGLLSPSPYETDIERIHRKSKRRRKRRHSSSSSSSCSTASSWRSGHSSIRSRSKHKGRHKSRRKYKEIPIKEPKSRDEVDAGEGQRGRYERAVLHRQQRERRKRPRGRMIRKYTRTSTHHRGRMLYKDRPRGRKAKVDMTQFLTDEGRHLQRKQSRYGYGDEKECFWMESQETQYSQNGLLQAESSSSKDLPSPHQQQCFRIASQETRFSQKGPLQNQICCQAFIQEIARNINQEGNTPFSQMHYQPKINRNQHQGFPTYYPKGNNNFPKDQASRQLILWKSFPRESAFDKSHCCQKTPQIPPLQQRPVCRHEGQIPAMQKELSHMQDYINDKNSPQYPIPCATYGRLPCGHQILSPVQARCGRHQIFPCNGELVCNQKIPPQSSIKKITCGQQIPEVGGDFQKPSYISRKPCGSEKSVCIQEPPKICSIPRPVCGQNLNRSCQNTSRSCQRPQYPTCQHTQTIEDSDSYEGRWERSSINIRNQKGYSRDFPNGRLQRSRTHIGGQDKRSRSYSSIHSPCQSHSSMSIRKSKKKYSKPRGRYLSNRCSRESLRSPNRSSLSINSGRWSRSQEHIDYLGRRSYSSYPRHRSRRRKTSSTSICSSKRDVSKKRSCSGSSGKRVKNLWPSKKRNKKELKRNSSEMGRWERSREHLFHQGVSSTSLVSSSLRRKSSKVKKARKSSSLENRHNKKSSKKSSKRKTKGSDSSVESCASRKKESRRCPPSSARGSGRWARSTYHIETTQPRRNSSSISIAGRSSNKYNKEKKRLRPTSSRKSNTSLKHRKTTGVGKKKGKRSNTSIEKCKSKSSPKHHCHHDKSSLRSESRSERSWRHVQEQRWGAVRHTEKPGHRHYGHSHKIYTSIKSESNDGINNYPMFQNHQRSPQISIASISQCSSVLYEREIREFNPVESHSNDSLSRYEKRIAKQTYLRQTPTEQLAPKQKEERSRDPIKSHIRTMEPCCSKTSPVRKSKEYQDNRTKTTGLLRNAFRRMLKKTKKKRRYISKPRSFRLYSSTNSEIRCGTASKPKRSSSNDSLERDQRKYEPLDKKEQLKDYD